VRKRLVFWSLCPKSADIASHMDTKMSKFQDPSKNQRFLKKEKQRRNSDRNLKIQKCKG